MRIGAVGIGAAVLGWSLGCVGFMDDIPTTGAPALQRIGACAGSPPPPGLTDAMVIDTTGIDWLRNGEARGPRAVVEPWFRSLSLPCDQPTVETTGGEPPHFQLLGQPSDWHAPTGRTWTTRSCEDSSFSGPHYSVSMTTDEDLAWIWVTGITL